MNNEVVPLGGFLRVVCLFGLAVVLATFLLSAVTNIYEGPSEEVPAEFRDLFVDEDQQDYNRNLGVIFSLLGSAVAAAGIIGLRRDQNHMRSGALLGGLFVLFAGLIYAGSGSNDWLVGVWALIAAAILIVCGPFLEDGGAFDLLPGRARPRGTPMV